MATRKYTVTLPAELAEEIREAVGPGNFSQYVAHAIERRRQQERLREWVDWWEGEYGAATEAEIAAADAELRELDRMHAERKARLAADERQPEPEPQRKAS